jgi:3-oxoacyl-ACP reductase-like protein
MRMRLPASLPPSLGFCRFWTCCHRLFNRFTREYDKQRNEDCVALQAAAAGSAASAAAAAAALGASAAAVSILNTKSLDFVRVLHRFYRVNKAMQHAQVSPSDTNVSLFHTPNTHFFVCIK